MSDLRSWLFRRAQRAPILFAGFLAVSVCIEESAALAQEPFRPTPQQAAQYAKYEALQQEAMQLKEQGKWREAAAKVREAIPVVDGVLGPVNAQSYYAWDWIASLLTDNKEFTGAIDARRRALALSDKLYSQQPWKVADAKNQLRHVERIAQFTPDEWNQHSAAMGQMMQMIKHWQAGEYEQAFAAGAPGVQKRMELLGDDDSEAIGGHFFLGRIAFDVRDFASAEKLFQDHLKLVQGSCGEIHPSTASIYSWLGKTYREMGDPRRSLEFWVKALNISRQVQEPDDPTLGDDVAGTAQAYEEAGMSDKALPLFEEVLALTERTNGKQSVDYAKSLSNCGASLASLYRNREARQRYEQAIATLEELPEDAPDRNLSYAAALSNLGALCRDTGDLAEAKRRLTQAVQFTEQRAAEGLGEAVPAALNQLSLTDADFADWPAAFEHQRQAIEFARKMWGDDHPTSLSLLHDMGILFWRTGSLSAARVNLEAVLRGRINVLGENHELVAKSLSELAFLLSDLGDYPQAAEYANMSIPVAFHAGGEESVILAFCYQNAALLMGDLGQELPKAVGLMEKSLAIRTRVEGEDNPDVAQALLNMASLYETNGDYDKSLATLRQSRQAYERIYGQGSLETLTSTFNLGSAYRRRGDFSAALKEFQTAAALAEANLPSTHPDVAACLAHRGACEAHVGKFDDAWRSLRKAFALRQAMFDEQLPTMSASQMSDFAGTVGGELDALLSLPLEHAPSSEVATCVLQSKSRALNMLCRLQAVERAAIDDPSLAAHAANAKAAREVVGRLTIRPPKSLSAEQLAAELAGARRKLELAESQVNIRLAERIGREADVPGARSITAALPAGAVLIEFIKYLPTDFAAQEKRIVSLPPRYAALVLRSGDAKDIQRVDLGEAAAIDRGVAELALQIQAAREWYRSGVKLKDEESLEGEYLESASQISTLLFAPLAEALGDSKLVYLAPDGELSGLSFESLVDANGKYLVELGYRFAYLTSGRDLLHPTSPPGRGTAVFAAPNYNLGAGERAKLAPKRGAESSSPPPNNERSPSTRGLSWESYPGFVAEGESAAASFNRGDFAPVTSYSGDKALEESFKQLGNVRALVLVTHGYFLESLRVDLADANDVLTVQDRGGESAAQGLGRLRRSDNPLLRSGLILAGANRASDEEKVRPAGPEELAAPKTPVEDGWLTANEIAGLNLRGVQLTVLSACNSGREATGCGDSIAGLRTAFLSAGVQSFVGSLFEVPDKETAEMMKPFYDAVAAGKSPLDALVAAEKRTIERRRKEHGAAHPFFWASFVLAGRP